MKKSLFIYLAFFLICISSVCATESYAVKKMPIDPEMIYGGVRQANSNKPIKDVSITVIQHNTNREKMFQTNGSGEFGIVDLRPGTYKLVFQKDGYKKVVKDKIIVRTENVIELQIEMEETGYDLSPFPFHFFKL
jgi:5-hydroxyisourate hydrolase-like protein (transthyretin family)